MNHIKGSFIIYEMGALLRGSKNLSNAAKDGRGEQFSNAAMNGWGEQF